MQSEEQALQKANRWLNDMRAELQFEDRDIAYQVLRSVLHAIRDRLKVEEVARLGTQLPTLIRGLYYEGWNPKRVSFKDKGRPTLFMDVQKTLPVHPMMTTENLVRAVLKVVRYHVSAREIEDMRRCLPKKLRTLWVPLAKKVVS